MNCGTNARLPFSKRNASRTFRRNTLPMRAVFPHEGELRQKLLRYPGGGRNEKLSGARRAGELQKKEWKRTRRFRYTTSITRGIPRGSRSGRSKKRTSNAGGMRHCRSGTRVPAGRSRRKSLWNGWRRLSRIGRKKMSERVLAPAIQTDYPCNSSPVLFACQITHYDDTPPIR